MTGSIWTREDLQILDGTLTYKCWAYLEQFALTRETRSFWDPNTKRSFKGGFILKAGNNTSRKVLQFMFRLKQTEHLWRLSSENTSVSLCVHCLRSRPSTLMRSYLGVQCAVYYSFFIKSNHGTLLSCRGRIYRLVKHSESRIILLEAVSEWKEEEEEQDEEEQDEEEQEMKLSEPSCVRSVNKETSLCCHVLSSRSPLGRGLWLLSWPA